MALSDQLTDLAGRTKRLEDAASDANEKNKAKLEQDREKLHSKVMSDAQQIQASIGNAQSATRSWWADVTTEMEHRRSDLRSKINERKAERKVERATRNADEAEAYATDLISMAAYLVDAAEYAAVDAAVARSEADALTATV